ncbi:MAG TPA: aa3-type cytochrome c oxidase subunit IV [Roseovarius sp.]|nr:aa3-type cytochrome c oxidase subunit IV [Roseovarius sp.]
MKDTGNMADHKHGEMDIEVQEKTFDGFVKIVAWSCVAIIAFLIFVAMVNA